MPISWTDIEVIAPELATVPIETQTAILADVDLQLSQKVWGTRYDLGRKYLAAHLATLTLQGGQGPGGPITSEGIGPARKSYAVPSSNSLYSTTSYGREYLRLLQLLPRARMGVT